MRSPSARCVSPWRLLGTISPLRSTATRLPSSASSRIRSATVAWSVHRQREPLSTIESTADTVYRYDGFYHATAVCRGAASQGALGHIGVRRLAPVVLHRPVQKAQLPCEATARLAQEQVQPKPHMQREGNVAVLHLRKSPTRVLACDHQAQFAQPLRGSPGSAGLVKP